MEGGRWPYYALNPLRGGASSFAKASEDMSKGARGGRGGNFEIRNAEIGNWKLESVKVRMWECGVVVWGLSVGDLGDVAPT